MTTMPAAPHQTADDRLLAEVAVRMERRDRWRGRREKAAEVLFGVAFVIYLLVGAAVWAFAIAGVAHLVRWVTS